MKPGEKISNRFVVDSSYNIGCGTVYRAHDTVLDGMPVYVRMLKEENWHLAKTFISLVQGMGKIKHPHIVPILSIDEHEGKPFYVTREYKNLEELMIREHLSAMDSVMLGRDIFRGLSHLHKNNIVHGHISPRNICCVERENKFFYYVSDSILQRLIPGYEDSFQGKPWYLAPETAQKKPDAKSDVYMAGCLVYTVLSKQFPVRHFERLDKGFGVTPELNAIIHKTFQRNPRRRPSAREVRNLFFKEFERYDTDHRDEPDTNADGINKKKLQ